MRAQRQKANAKKRKWREALITETSRRQRPRVHETDICRDFRRLKRAQAEQRSTEKHDKQYRREQRAAKGRLHADRCFVDSSLCDVEAYHNKRQQKCGHIDDALTFRWMEFESKYKQDGVWTAPVLDTDDTESRSGVLAHFRREHSPHSLHRWLIAQCRIQVWGDKGLGRIQPTSTATAQFLCQKCHAPMSTTRFEMLCTSCGNTVPRVKRADMNMKELESVQETAPSYKRNNHLHEWITRVQARERKVVPMAVKQAVLQSFEKWGFDRYNPKQSLVRRFLRDAGYQRYFEHIPQIMHWLSGKKQIVFDDDTVCKIKKVFNAIQGPFEKHKPPGRKNFLSYGYILYKVCELLELDDLLHAFRLLKSRTNLMKADKVWRGICNDCGYQYIPTT